MSDEFHGINQIQLLLHGESKITVNIHGTISSKIEVNRLPSPLTLTSIELIHNIIEFNGAPCNNIDFYLCSWN